MGMQKAFHEGHDRPPMVFDYLVKELRMTPEQVKQYEPLRDEHHNTVEGLRAENRVLRDKMWNIAAGGKQDSTAIGQLADSIGVNERKIEWITFTHFQEVRALCTPEQQRKFDALIHEVMQMMAPPPPPPPGK
jgi:protein CpxP